MGEVTEIALLHLFVTIRPMTLISSDAFVQSLPLPAVLIGPADKVMSMNERAISLFKADATGRNMMTLIRQPAVLDAIDDARRSGRPTEARHLGREGGRDTTFRAHVAPVIDPSGLMILLTLEDLTAVEEAGKMRRDFVANVSHELRTPLTAMLGFIETLQGAARNDANARDRFLSIMEREAGRMSRLVDDLLSLGRVEENERVRPSSPVDLCGLIQSSVRALDPLASAADITLNVDLPEGEINIPADEGQMRQVLANLIENAIKYGANGGRVDIRLSRPAKQALLGEEGVILQVRDYGEGIAAHQIPRLTERFYRVDTHRSREIGGTGLGLAIVKHIVNRHRGRLRIESQLGQGTSFFVILPTG